MILTVRNFKNSKGVWSGNTTITNCRQPRGTARKSRSTITRHQEDKLSKEGCSNMNASSFITFVTYMLRQNGIRFYKGLYVTFKLAPYLKQNLVDLSSYRPSNEGHFCILTNSILRTYHWYRRAYSSSINRWNFLKFLKKYPHILIKWFCKSCKTPTSFC